MGQPRHRAGRTRSGEQGMLYTRHGRADATAAPLCHPQSGCQGPGSCPHCVHWRWNALLCGTQRWGPAGRGPTGNRREECGRAVWGDEHRGQNNEERFCVSSATKTNDFVTCAHPRSGLNAGPSAALTHRKLVGCTIRCGPGPHAPAWGTCTASLHPAPFTAFGFALQPLSDPRASQLHGFTRSVPGAPPRPARSRTAGPTTSRASAAGNGPT